MADLIAYRKDIDGLRAVAVVSVVVFHLFRSALPGGYLGVDIFFVISGYLITTIIWKEQTAGHFSVLRFYERRLRRIMPALLAMLAAVTLLSIAILLPLDLVGYARSLLATLLFASNIYFMRDADYFARTAEEKPLLHTWSLGIEEQFYIFFPLLLALCARIRPRATLAVVLLVTVGSLVANMAVLKVGKAIPAFYLLPTRAWELGLGALVAVTPVRPATTQRGDAVLAWLGALLVGLSLAMNGIALLKPAPTALPACLGAAAIIWSGRSRGSAVSGFLGLRPIVFLGLVSYSLYLWHWPLIVLPKYYLVRDLTVRESLLSAGTAFLLAVLSWRYIERPFRGRSLPLPKVLLIAGLGTALVAMAALATLLQGGFPSRLDARAAVINAAVGSNYRCALGDYVSFGALYGCKLELPSGNPQDADIAIVGDSHSQMYAPVIAKTLKAHSLKGLLVPANGCLPFREPNLGLNCSNISSNNLDAIAALKNVRAVIIAFNWDFTPKKLVYRDGSLANAADIPGVLVGLDKTIDEFEAAGKKVILVGPIAIPGFDVASVVGRKLAFGQVLDVPTGQPTASFLEKWAPSIRRYEAREGLIFIRPDRVQCPAEQCEYLLDGRSLFADSNHLAAAETVHFEPMFEQALSEIAPR